MTTPQADFADKLDLQQNVMQLAKTLHDFSLSVTLICKAEKIDKLM